MKLQLTSYRSIYTIETKNDDLDANEYLDIFKRLLVQATFNESTVNEAIIELADEIKIDYDTKD